VVRQILIKNKTGFTLLELLVALVIIMISMMALLASINLSISSNMNNELRQHAVGLAEDTLNGIKNMPFDNITGQWLPAQQRQLFLRGTPRRYLITKTVTPSATTNSKQVQVGVSWSNKGNNYEHTAATIVARTVGSTQ
jgi:type IV pilus assembly protein PilV